MVVFGLMMLGFVLTVLVVERHHARRLHSRRGHPSRLGTSSLT
jgi:hypothetical protein